MVGELALVDLFSTMAVQEELPFIAERVTETEECTCCSLIGSPTKKYYASKKTIL